MRIFHLALADTWAEARRAGTYRTSTLGRDLDEVGFIHCAHADQVAGVHERFYAQVAAPLVLLTIETDLLSVPWQLEDVPGHDRPFPHVYGPIDPAAVVSVDPFTGSASS